MDCIHAVDDGEEIEGKYVPQWTFYLNENNAALESELKNTKGSVDLLKKKFEIAAVLMGMALIHEEENNKKKYEDSSNDDAEFTLENKIKQVSRALSPVLLPMVDGISSLDIDNMESEFDEYDEAA